MAELTRSLHTKEPGEARQRCLTATVWFKRTIEMLRRSPSLTRADLETAAAEHFRELLRDVDQPRPFDDDHLDAEVQWNIECSRNRVSELDNQLQQNLFDKAVTNRACELVQSVGSSIDELDDRMRLFTCQLAARAEREQMLALVHSLTTPHRRYVPEDDTLVSPAAVHATEGAYRHTGVEPPVKVSLREAAANYISRKQGRNLSTSQIDELARALGWLRERLGDLRPLSSITVSEMRGFRDDLARLDVRLRGRALPFEKRLTNQPQRQIKSATALRYWRSVQTFFRWSASEQLIAQDPAGGLKLEGRKGKARRTPPPFTREELIKLFATPLYAGYQSPKRVATAGSCRMREGHWWSGVLLMYTGLRAGELAQFLAEDFVFDTEVPHIKVREVDDQGQRTKSTKNAHSPVVKAFDDSYAR